MGQKRPDHTSRRLTPFAALDERTTLARPDLAEQALEGLVRAAAFRAVEPSHCRVAVADLFADADAGAQILDQLIFGEAFDVLDQQGGFAWGRARRDGSVGWVATSALSRDAPLATHRVAVTGAALPLNALVHHIYCGVVAEDLQPIGVFERDPAAVAERLLGTPHRLGARSSIATDCSGMVQQALYACGLPGPRHSDQQAELGRAVERSDLRRGDIVVLPAEPGHEWTGHSALALDAGRVIHATGHHGRVVIEDLALAEARYAADGFRSPVFRRID